MLMHEASCGTFVTAAKKTTFAGTIFNRVVVVTNVGGKAQFLQSVLRSLMLQNSYRNGEGNCFGLTEPAERCSIFAPAVEGAALLLYMRFWLEADVKFAQGSNWRSCTGWMSKKLPKSLLLQDANYSQPYFVGAVMNWCFIAGADALERNPVCEPLFNIRNAATVALQFGSKIAKIPWSFTRNSFRRLTCLLNWGEF